MLSPSGRIPGIKRLSQQTQLKAKTAQNKLMEKCYDEHCFQRSNVNASECITSKTSLKCYTKIGNFLAGELMHLQRYFKVGTFVFL